jgi:hypothetical protein
MQAGCAGLITESCVNGSPTGTPMDEYVRALELAVEGLANLTRQEWPQHEPCPLAFAVDTWAFGTLGDHDAHVEALRKLESGAFPEQNAWRP